jgi:hypothetical protein
VLCWKFVVSGVGSVFSVVSVVSIRVARGVRDSDLVLVRDSEKFHHSGCGKSVGSLGSIANIGSIGRIVSPVRLELEGVL